MKAIVSDTTALIILVKSDSLNLLENLVDKVYVPNAVMQEINYKDDNVKAIINRSNFIEVKNVDDKEILKEIKSSKLDIGEIEAIALALETGLSLIIDEKAGRKYAKSKGIDIIGLLGILKINFIQKYISYIDLLYIFDEFQKINFRVSPALEKSFLESLQRF